MAVGEQDRGRPAPGGADGDPAQVLARRPARGRRRRPRRRPARRGARCWCRPASSARGWAPAHTAPGRCPCRRRGSRPRPSPPQRTGSTPSRPATVSQTAPSAVKISGISAAIRRRTASAADTVVVAASSAERRRASAAAAACHRACAAADGVGRADPGHPVGLAADVAGALPVRQRGDEEPRVVAALLDHRGDPVRPGAQQVGAQHEAAPVEQRGQRQRPVQQRLPVGLPVLAAGVGDDGVRGRARRAARRTPRTSPVRRRRPARGRASAAPKRPAPLRRVTARPSRPSIARRAGPPNRPGRRRRPARTPSTAPGAACRPAGRPRPGVAAAGSRWRRRRGTGRRPPWPSRCLVRVRPADRPAQAGARPPTRRLRRGPASPRDDAASTRATLVDLGDQLDLDRGVSAAARPRRPRCARAGPRRRTPRRAGRSPR